MIPWLLTRWGWPWRAHSAAQVAIAAPASSRHGHRKDAAVTTVSPATRPVRSNSSVTARAHDVSMTDVADQWLGAGFLFPLFPDGNGKLGYVAGLDLVRQSIETILDTDPGERIMRPSFGCGLRRYLMAPNTLTTRTAMAADITTALNTWEPRIQVTNVSVTPDDNPTLVWIEISYVRLADRRPDNLVYPFYLA